MKTAISIILASVFGAASGQSFGNKISGNFDGKTSSATIVKVREGRGNPMEDGTPNGYELRFSDKKLGKIKIGCCKAWLINEGDLNGDGFDEVSVYQAPVNGCTYEMRTFSFKGKVWRKVIPTFMIPTGCDGISQKDLMHRVYRDGKNIYYLKTDPNDFSKLIQMKVEELK